MFELLSLAFAGSSLLFGIATLLLTIKSTWGTHWSPVTDVFSVFSGIAISFALLAHIFTIPFHTIFFNGYIFSAAFLLVLMYFTSYSPAGIFFYVTNILIMVTSIPWSIIYILNLDISLITKVLMSFSLPLLILTLPFGIIQIIEQYDVLCRTSWKRPRTPKCAKRNAVLPMVSLHVPTYAEPPEIVIATLNKISALNYTNFEVIVIDNNTQDESLWRPVESHCTALGPQFRFFHVDNLAGAKGGALNYALIHTDPYSEIIGVIDADYHPEPNFIIDLIGHFDDPKRGFVQTPHDYRDWENNTYLEMCYWEYKAFFHTILVSLNERGAALTIGTMCLIRKSALQAAGGWSTWCVTEDSELAIRIHDSGYNSIYIPVTYGRGLIPDRFEDYSKQRFRWIAGPVQELLHHHARYFDTQNPDSHLNITQRIHHLHHGLGSALFSLQLPLLCIAVLLALSMVLQKEIIIVPFTLWLAVTTLLCTYLLLQWLQYKTLLKTTVRRMLLAIIAHKALTYTVNTAALKTLINPRQPWRRTNKFKINQRIFTALSSTYTQSLIGLSLIGFALVCYVSLPYPGMLTMCLLGISLKGLEYLCTPAVAIQAVLSQRTKTQTDSLSFAPKQAT